MENTIFNQKTEAIGSFVDAIGIMTDAIESMEADGISVSGAKTVLSIVHPEALKSFDRIVSLISQEVEAPISTIHQTTTSEQTSSDDCNKHIPYSISEEMVRNVCEAMIKVDFSRTATIAYLEEHNIPYSMYVINKIRSKARWNEITDEYFTKDGRKFIKVDRPESHVEDAESTAPTFNVVMPEEKLQQYIKGVLAAERDSIKKAFQKIVEDGEDVTIFDVFNVKYSAELRKSPIKSDDIGVVVRAIAPSYEYDIGDISRVMREKCDVYLDAAQFRIIRKMATKAGTVAREPGGRKAPSRKTTLNDDDDKIAHVMVRDPIYMDLIETYRHMRAGMQNPPTMIDIYKVKYKIGTVTDNDIRKICVNLNRSCGMYRVYDVIDTIKKELNVDVTEVEVRTYWKMYEDYKRLNPTQHND